MHAWRIKPGATAPPLSGRCCTSAIPIGSLGRGVFLQDTLISVQLGTGWESEHHPNTNAAPSLPGSEASSKNSVWKSHAEAPEEDRHGPSSGPGGHHHPGGSWRHHGDPERLPGIQRQAGGCQVMALLRPRARPLCAPRTQLLDWLIPKCPSRTQAALLTKPEVPASPPGDP